MNGISARQSRAPFGAAATAQGARRLGPVLCAVLCVCLAVFSGGCGREAEPPSKAQYINEHDFRAADWGMSEAEVRRAECIDPARELSAPNDVGRQEIMTECALNGFDAVTHYGFMDGKFSDALYVSVIDGATAEQAHKLFADGIRSLYGESAEADVSEEGVHRNKWVIGDNDLWVATMPKQNWSSVLIAIMPSGQTAPEQ